MTYAQRYTIRGALLGSVIPLVGYLLFCLEHGTPALTAAGLRAALLSPLFLMVCTVPLLIGGIAAMAGYARDGVTAQDAARREGFLRTATELFTAAQSLLSSVSAFSSTTAETAASVRETTATMGQLGHTATRAALTAETVIGLARKGERASRDGLATIDSSIGEMVKLAEEVRVLSSSIEGLNSRMRDVFEISAVVTYLADRSERLAEHAAAEAGKPGAPRAVTALVAELRQQATEAKGAAVKVKAMLTEVHRTMLAAMTAAEVGIRSAEQGAQVASGTGDTIRMLATALQESSQAAKEIATVAQQQDHGIDQVLKAMNEIYLATQETMSSTQAVATEAKALNDLAQGLKRAVEA
jgi:methyl-accepting chemotaxis protein